MATAQAAPGDHLERLARRGTASVLGAGFSAVSGVGLVVVVTNGFSPALAGTLFAATSAFLIVESIALLGVDTGLVRSLPTYAASGRMPDVRTALLGSLGPVLLASTLTALAMFLAAPTLAPALVGPDQAATMTTMVEVLALALPVAALYDGLTAATRGLGTMRPTVLVENVGRQTLQAVGVLAAYLVGAGTLGLVLSWSLPYVLGLLGIGVWMWRLVQRRTAAAAGSPRPWRPVLAEFWAYTTPRAIARVVQTALKRSDIVLVAALASPTEAALYTAATRFVVFGQLLVQSVQQALAPHLSGLFARHDTDAARSVFQSATVWSMLVAWPMYLVFAAIAPSLMAVFGKGYGSADGVVVILSLAMLFATACGPVDSVLLMAGRSWLSLANNSVALVLNLGMNFVLIPRLGIEGAALSWAVAIVVRNLLPLVQVRRDHGMWPGTAAGGYVAVGAVVGFGLTGLVARLAGLPLLPSLVVIAVGAAGYLAGIWFLRGPLHLVAFRAALRRRASR